MLFFTLFDFTLWFAKGRFCRRSFGFLVVVFTNNFLAYPSWYVWLYYKKNFFFNHCSPPRKDFLKLVLWIFVIFCSIFLRPYTWLSSFKCSVKSIEYFFNKMFFLFCLQKRLQEQYIEVFSTDFLSNDCFFGISKNF